MASERKHFKRLKRFHHGVFSAEESSQGTSTPAQSLSSPQPTNADLYSVEPESVPPVAALPLPPSSNPATTSAHLPSAEPPVDTPMQAPQLEQTYTANSRAVKTRDNTQAIKRKGWNGLKQFASVLSKTPDVFGPLEHAADVLVSFIDTFETAAENRTEWQQLKSELDGLFEDLHEHMDASVPPMMTKSIENLEKGIKKETDFIEQIQKRSDIHRYLSAGKGVDEVLNCYRRIKDLFRRLSLNANIDTWKKLDELATYTYLKGLPNSEAAYYRSADSIKLNRTGCTENTRVDVLRDIYNWARGQWPQKIYWLNGMAGTGKTTIAYSLCKRLEEEKMLAASFFCSRQLPECRNVNRIVPTIAYQLSNYSAPFRHVISPLLQTDISVYNKPILDQFQELIIEPINKVKASLPTDLIIVVDALDECEAETGTADILDVLLAHASALPLRFFVSSRPDEAIITRMRETQADGVNTEMRLHELASDIVQANIRTYLRTKLESCMSISELKVNTLVERSGVLFIYASTVVRYISNASVGKRAKRLEEVLDVSAGSSNESTQGIDALYISILSAAHDSERLNKSDRDEMMLVLHTVVCACEPLSTSTMADLLDLDSEQTVQSILFPLLSVLQISESGVVTTLHESFRDFLLQGTRSERFHCNTIEHNGRLAELCFRQIEKQVPFNICGLESSYVLDKDVHGLGERVDRTITKALFYACCYWDAHMSLTDSSESLAEQLFKFLSERMLLWMEIMNLKDVFRQGITMLYNMKEWSRETSALGKMYGQLLEDGWRFMSTHSSESVLSSTPHLYVSALLFWPDESPMRRYYESKGRDMIGEKSTAMGQRNTRPVHTMSNGSSVNCVAYSPNEEQIAVALHNNNIYIWSAHTGKQISQPLQGHTSSVSSIAYSHDSAYVVSGSYDKTVRIWDARTGEQIGQPLQGHTSSVNSVAYSHDSAYVVSGSYDKTVRIWDARTGEQIGQPLQGHTDWVYSVAYSHDSAYIVSGSYDNTVRIWDAHTGEQTGQPLQGHTYSVYSVAYSHDGAYIVTGSGDDTVRIWDAHTGEQIGEPLQGHTESVTSVAYSHDSAYIVSGSDDETVRIWDAHTDEQIGQPLQGHTNSVTSVAYSHDSAYIVSGSDDKTVRIWDAHTGEQIGQPLQGHTDWVYSVAYSHDSAYIVSGSYDNTVRIWDAHTGEQIGQPLQGYTDWVYSVAYSHDSAYIVSGSDDETVRIWDAHAGEQIGQPLEGHTDSVRSVAYSHDSAYIVSGSNDKTVRIWDAHTGEQIGQPLQGHTNSVTSVAYSHDSAYIVSGSDDKTVRIWDAHTGEQIGQPLEGHTDSVRSVAYSHDSAYIVTGSDDKTVRIWDAHTGEQIGQPLQGHTYSVTSVAYSHDSAYIVSGSWDKTVRIWDAHTGKQIGHSLQGHTDWVYSVAYSHNGAYIVSGSRDNTVRVWNAHTGEQIGQPLQGHTDSVNSVADSHDSTCITSGSEDNTLKDVHAPSEASPLTSEQYIKDTQSHFQVSLEQLRQLNLSPCFSSFANQVDNLSGSLAMLLHHWQVIVGLWVETVSLTDGESLKPLIELSTCIVYDLRQTLLPVATNVLSTLLSLLSLKLAPDVLEPLLKALTTHLKMLVLPNSTTLLDSAWNNFISAAESNEAHVRMLAEVWGPLMRKLKKEEKERAVKILVEDKGEFGVWCLVEATRAKQAQGVYATATDLIGPLVDLHIDGKGRETSRLTRRVLTALVHHSKAESFAGVAGVVVGKVETEVGRMENKEVEEEERLIRAMEVATVMCAVRKGGKLTSATVSTLLSLVPRMMAILKPRPETRAFIIGPGRRALDVVWQDLIEGMRIAAILSELGWGGWKSMVLPHVLRRTPKTLTTSPVQTLTVLACLYSVLRCLIGSNVGDAITNLLDILTLSPTILDAGSGVSRIIQPLHAPGEKDRSPAGLNSVRQLNAGVADMVERWIWSEEHRLGLNENSCFKPVKFPQEEQVVYG
ncbi:Vegetative incompatibility protein HET-E-1 [Ceratobasidium sp. AG-Ba]|nr:Vegetative incompatibility protein HET-E-1 [Ceratobasidium sp. AG-Ba]